MKTKQQKRKEALARLELSRKALLDSKKMYEDKVKCGVPTDPEVKAYYLRRVDSIKCCIADASKAINHLQQVIAQDEHKL